MDPTELNEPLQSHVFLKVLESSFEQLFPQWKSESKEYERKKNYEFSISVAFFIAVERQRVSKLQTRTLGGLKKQLQEATNHRNQQGSKGQGNHSVRAPRHPQWLCNRTVGHLVGCSLFSATVWLGVSP